MKSGVIIISLMLFFAPLQFASVGDLINDLLKFIQKFLAYLPFIGDRFIDEETGEETDEAIDDAESKNLKLVKVNESFDIELQQPLHPAYEWKCIEHDENYLVLIDEGLKAPPDSSIMGVTIKYFTFDPVKRGETTLRFGYGEIGLNEKITSITREVEYTVKVS